jgi:hypothetical protein
VAEYSPADLPAGHATIASLLEAEVWRPTMRLRWMVPADPYARAPELQQAWLSERGAVQWRPVPHVPEGSDA